MPSHALARKPEQRIATGYPELLTMTEAAAVLGVSPKYVKAAAMAGELPTKRFGGTWRILRDRLHSVR